MLRPLIENIRRLSQLLVVTATLFIISSTTLFAANNSKVTLHEYDYSKTYYPGENWLKAESPEQLGWSSEKLVIAKRFSDSLATAALLLIENGIIVEEWGSTRKKYKCHSMRKSIMNAMIGVAVSDNKIDISKTLADLGIDDLPPLSANEKKATVEDLLMSRSGIYHRAAYETKSMRKKRPERYSHKPGTFWYYNNWDFNALLTVFEKEAGKGFFSEFQSRIANPLQMEQFQITDTQYFWEKKYSQHPAYLFRMSSRDLGRFGLLYLRKGKWLGQQIIPESWVEYSSTMHSKITKSGSGGYGLLWWIKNDIYYAEGNRGHKLVLFPERKLVLIHRVNTDKSKGRVSSKKFWKLVSLILKAKKQEKSFR